MSLNDDKSINTLHSTNKKKIYEKDSIPVRIEFIRNLLKEKDLNPIVDFDITDTEHYIGRDNELDSGDSYDTRVVLKKRILDFKNVITQIGGKLKYIKSGTTGHTFKGMANDANGSFEYAVKVVAYSKKEKYGSINDTRRPENAELMMIKLLSYFIVNRQTPHLTIPFGTFNTSIENFVNLVKCDKIDEKNDRYKEFIERYENDEFSSNVSILISEWANKGDLLDFFRNNYKVFTPRHWKVIFFQLLSVLAIIQSKYPAFRHNDMKANNILVQKIDKSRENHKYIVVRSLYRVPNIGYHIKLWDFDFACIPGIVDNIKVESKWTKKINVTPEQNRYYDIHYFFNTLIRKGFFPQILADDIVPLEVKEFIDRVVPKKYREGEPYVHEKGRILTNIEHTTPDILLKNDPYFEEFRIKQDNIKENEHSTNKQNIQNIQNIQSAQKNSNYDLNKLLTSDNLLIPSAVYTLNKRNTTPATNATTVTNVTTVENTNNKKKLKSSKVEKNIDILKLLENSSNQQDKEKSTILDQLDIQLKKATKSIKSKYK
jgi:hypothetical protein